MGILCHTAGSRDSHAHTLRPCLAITAYPIPRVLARMRNLRSPTLPSFHLHIMRPRSPFDLHDIMLSDTKLSGQAEAKLLTWLDGQTNVISFHFPLPLLLDNDATTRHLSAPTPLLTLTQDIFTHAAATLLPNLTTLHGPPHLVILFAPSLPRYMLILVLRPPSSPSVLLFDIAMMCSSMSVKRTEGKILRSPVVIYRIIEELQRRERPAKSVGVVSFLVSPFKYRRVLVMRISGMAEVKAVREGLDERFPLPQRARTRPTLSTISGFGRSMVVSERAVLRA